LLQRRRGILRRPPAFERIAARLFPSADISGLAGGATEFLEAIVARLKFVIAERPILDGHIVRKEGLAVALFEMAAQAKIGRQKSPGLPVPVHARAAHAIARKKAREIAHRQRRLTGVVAERQRLLFGTKKQVEPDRIAQLVLSVGRRKIRGRIAPGTTFDRHDVEARFC
jgi:hypothetical protein